MNKCFLIGRLVKDPDQRVTGSGISVTSFSIAVDRIRKRDGQEGVTDFIRVVTWRRLAEICGQYLKKGKLICIEGRLQFDHYMKEDKRIERAEVVADTMQMLDRGLAEAVDTAQAATAGSF
ncbi:MAG: single-stranded DNA-binding protein [bacterium]